MSDTVSSENHKLSPIIVAGPSASEAGTRGLNRVVFLLSLSVFINYIDRSNLSIAAPLLQRELGISYSQLGVLFSAFFWPYALMQMPAGWLVDHFDVKWVFAAGFFLWSAATAVTGTLHGFAALIVIRVILGLGESIVFPSCSKILGTHLVEKRRGFANALLMAGLSLGPALGILFGGVVIGRFGWRPFFVTLGLASLLWLVPWLAWMPRWPNRPALVPNHQMGYLRIFRERSAWGTCLGQFCINYFLYFLVTWLPTYLVRGRGFSANDMAKAGSLVFFMSAVSATAGGKLCDRWLNAGTSLTSVRKACMVLGHVGIGISLAATVFTHGAMFIVMLALTGIFLGISVCNSWAIAQTLAGPLAAGRWTGLQNFVGNFAGWVAPALTGILADRTGSFRWPFFITAAVAWVGALSWGWVVGPVEQCDWKKYAGTARVGASAAPDALHP
jgi:ACS family D-galactonate transporter-like MFS transporter